MRTALRLLGVLALPPALLASPVLAQGIGDPHARDTPGQTGDADQRERGWVDIGIGWGPVRLEGAHSFEGSSLALDLTAGLWLSSRIALGVRAGGWTLEGFDLSDPRQGESLSELFALLKVRPLGHVPFLISVASGWTSYTANDPAAVLLEGDGVGWHAAAEWDAWRSGRWSVGAALAASWGSIDPGAAAGADIDYRGGAVLVRGRWHW